MTLTGHRDVGYQPRRYAAAITTKRVRAVAIILPSVSTR